jgi:hypothetical protein
VSLNYTQACGGCAVTEAAFQWLADCCRLRIFFQPEPEVHS